MKEPLVRAGRGGRGEAVEPGLGGESLFNGFCGAALLKGLGGDAVLELGLGGTKSCYKIITVLKIRERSGKDLFIQFFQRGQRGEGFQEFLNVVGVHVTCQRRPAPAPSSIMIKFICFMC
jgi:hypothetical protein